jgi:hypothetical protein
MSLLRGRPGFTAVGAKNDEDEVARHEGQKLVPLGEVIRRVGEHQCGVFALGNMQHRIAPHDRASRRQPEVVDVLFQTRERIAILLDESHMGSTAAECFDAECTSASKTIHDACAGQVVMATEADENGLTRHVGGGPSGLALWGFDATATKFACHHSHALNAIAALRYLLDCCSER